MTTNQKRLRTWGQAVEYTFKYRDKWRHADNNNARRNVNLFSAEHGLNYELKNINFGCISRFQEMLKDTYRSNATINRITSSIHTVLQTCADHELCKQPGKWPRLEEPESRYTWYKQSEVLQMASFSAEYMRRPELADLIVFAAWSGLRQGELLKLRAMDIDLVHRLIHVGGRPEVVTKSRKYRSIPMSDKENRLFTIGERLVRLAEKDTEKVFGKDWISKDDVLRQFKKCRVYINKDEHYVFHSLRHSFVTWQCMNGTPIGDVMHLAGHADISTTMRYAHVNPQNKVNAMERI